MKGIEITLHRNKQYEAENEEDYKVIAGENNATTINVHFPEEYENYSKRVDFKNIRNEKWTVPLYTPEDQEQEYEEEFDKLNFSFTIPSPVTVNGELQIQFIAYLTDGTDTFVPFEIVKIEVQDSIMYVKKKSSENPDLIIHAFENSNQALELAELSIEDAEKSIEIVDNLTVSCEELLPEQQVSVEIQTDASNKHKNIHFKIPILREGGGSSVEVVDNLDSDRSDYALSAKQGKVLKEMNCNVIQRDSNDNEIVINNIVLVEV